MGMLEGPPNLNVKPMTAEFEVRRRPEEIEHARTLRPLHRPVAVQHVSGLIAPLVAGVANEGHGDYRPLRAAFFALAAGALAFGLPAFAAGFAVFLAAG